MSDELLVFYDDRCAFCRHCRDWILAQRALVPLRLVPRTAAQRDPRWAALWTGEADELIAVRDGTQIYRGPSAFLLCLWALADYRAWSFRLASPALRPLARAAFVGLSKSRHLLATENEACDVRGSSG